MTLVLYNERLHKLEPQDLNEWSILQIQERRNALKDTEKTR